MRVIYGAVLLLFAAAVAIFCIQNLQTISIAYLGWKINLPLPIVVLLVYLFGMISGWGLLSFLRRSIRHATRSRE